MQQALILNEDAFKNYSSLLHDAVCLGWNFDYQHKQLTMQLDGEDSIEKPYQITFRNVFGHEMISCDFWGPSPHLLGWSALTGEQRRLYPRYVDEIEKNGYTFARLLPGEKCMEVEVLFTSGDVLPSVYKGQRGGTGQVSPCFLSCGMWKQLPCSPIPSKPPTPSPRAGARP